MQEIIKKKNTMFDIVEILASPTNCDIIATSPREGVGTDAL